MFFLYIPFFTEIFKEEIEEKYEIIYDYFFHYCKFLLYYNIKMFILKYVKQNKDCSLL
jgi:hypothetical protein